MKLYLYRHSITKGNLEKRYIGKTNENLCNEGYALAKDIKTDKSVKKVYTSTLIRSIETAEIFFPYAKIIKVPELNEMDFGDFENKNYVELKDNIDYKFWIKSYCENRCTNGESKKEFMKRCCKSFENIINYEIQKEDNIYMVVHGGTIMSIMYTYSNSEKSYFDWNIKNCGCLEVDIDKNIWLKEKKFL